MHGRMSPLAAVEAISWLEKRQRRRRNRCGGSTRWHEAGKDFLELEFTIVGLGVQGSADHTARWALDGRISDAHLSPASGAQVDSGAFRQHRDTRPRTVSKLPPQCTMGSRCLPAWQHDAAARRHIGARLCRRCSVSTTPDKANGSRGSSLHVTWNIPSVLSKRRPQIDTKSFTMCVVLCVICHSRDGAEMVQSACTAENQTRSRDKPAGRSLHLLGFRLVRSAGADPDRDSLRSWPHRRLPAIRHHASEAASQRLHVDRGLCRV